MGNVSLDYSDSEDYPGWAGGLQFSFPVSGSRGPLAAKDPGSFLSVSEELVQLLATDLAKVFGGVQNAYAREIARSLIRWHVWS